MVFLIGEFLNYLIIYYLKGGLSMKAEDLYMVNLLVANLELYTMLIIFKKHLEKLEEQMKDDYCPCCGNPIGDGGDLDG